MSDNKKYYYLKLKETFFDSEEMKVIESMKNGIEYQNLYFRLCLLSLKNEGLLIFKNILPYDLDMLSTVLRVNIDTIKTGIEIFKKIGLVDKLDNGVLFMADIQSMIGQSSTEAERIKAYRAKTCALKERTNVQQKYELCTPELELEKELELELERKGQNTKNATKRKDQENKKYEHPTLDQCCEYVKENGLVINPNTFYAFYNASGWMKVNGQPVKNWKQTMQTWNSKELQNNPSVKPFLSRTLKKESIALSECPKCGGKLSGGACIECYTNYDVYGKEIT